MSFSIETYHGSYNRTKRTVALRYIVVHYTGSGTSKAGSARANCIYFSGGNRNASAHYFIDDAHVFEYADPSSWACWHVGDGHGRYGITNANSVGIEVCSSGADFTQAERERLRWLVGRLMARFGVPASRVVRHYDASRKCCPAPYCPNGGDPTGAKWKALHAYITGGSASSGTSSGTNGTSSGSRTVRVTTDALNVRKGPGTSYAVTGQIKDRGTYTIVEEQNGWGRLKSGLGWISLAYTTAATAKKSVDKVAREVIAGRWGTGDERRKRLKAAGYDYAKVQARVNELMG